MRFIQKASTSQSIVIRIIDSTTGLPENAVEHDTAGIDLWYRREAATKTSITEAALAALDSAYSAGGIELIGDGYYRFDIPDAAFAIGANGVMIGGTVTGMIVIGDYIPLVDYDPQDTIRLGLTALPNAVVDAAGGLPISDAGGLDLDTKLANTNEITVARMGALTDWINGGRLDLLLDAIPTTAMRGTDSAALAATALTDATWTDAKAAFLDASIAALENISAADVNTQVSDVIKTDTISEMAQGAPAATPTLEDAIMYLYMYFRNEVTQTATVLSLKNDGGTVITKATVSDDTTIFTKGEMVSGP